MDPLCVCWTYLCLFFQLFHLIPFTLIFFSSHDDSTPATSDAAAARPRASRFDAILPLVRRAAWRSQGRGRGVRGARCCFDGAPAVARSAARALCDGYPHHRRAVFLGCSPTRTIGSHGAERQLRQPLLRQRCRQAAQRAYGERASSDKRRMAGRRAFPTATAARAPRAEGAERLLRSAPGANDRAI